jgi:hypothetical protein
MRKGDNCPLFSLNNVTKVKNIQYKGKPYM